MVYRSCPIGYSIRNPTLLEAYRITARKRAHLLWPDANLVECWRTKKEKIVNAKGILPVILLVVYRIENIRRNKIHIRRK